MRLLGEGVEVFRPVEATRLDDDTFRLDDAPVPPDETWEFAPGTRVGTVSRDAPEGPVRIAAAVSSPAVRRAG